MFCNPSLLAATIESKCDAITPVHDVGKKRKIQRARQLNRKTNKALVR